jgi:4-hydroxythreonine-4-phosphate dehydrogenase
VSKSRLEGALAVSLGDPAGVGPELLAQAWAQRGAEGFAPFFVVGGAGLLAAAARTRGIDLPIARISDPGEAAGVFSHALPVLGELDGDYRPGAPDREGAALALASLTQAARLAVSGAAGGIVTGPVAKARLAELGFAHPGQTEFVAEACGVAAGDAVMMLAGPTLRTVPLTAALNPHAGEDGRMGDEEARVIAPAIAALVAEGIAATGPHPADALFAAHERGRFDAALCMYHDQALIPLKALDFDEGVNITLGLPIVRASADHGTAFAIAGKGLAHPGATIAAIRMAGACAARRASA